MIKKIMFSMLVAFAAFFAGCDWLKTTTSSIDAETYAKFAGKAVATIIVTSDKHLPEGAKQHFVGALDDVVTKLPKDITSTNIVAYVSGIVNAKLAVAVPDESQRKTITTVLNVVYGMLGNALATVEAKYSNEFKNADKAYALVVAFLTSAKSVFDGTMAAADDTPEYKSVYDDVLKAVNSTK